MLINIEKMKIGEKTPVSFSEMYKVPQEFALSDDAVNVMVQGVLKKEGDYFSFKGKASANVHSECGLCLAPAEEVLEFEIDDKFSETLDMLGTEEVWKIVSKKVDLSESVLNGLLIEIPARFICSEGCKGLCPKCGANLNKSQCGCKDEQIDERFAKLKDLFKEV